MLFTIKGCPCGNPNPHVKFLGEDGNESNGKFTLATAEKFISTKLTEGVITAKHAKDLRKNLRSFASDIRLPEKGPRLREAHKPQVIQFLLESSEKSREDYLRDLVSDGSATEEEVEYFRAEVARIESAPLTDEEKERIASGCVLASDEEIKQLFEELLSKGRVTEAEKEAILARTEEFRKIPIPEEDIAEMTMDLALMEGGEEVLDRIVAQGRISAEHAEKVRSEMKEIKEDPLFAMFGGADITIVSL